MVSLDIGLKNHYKMQIKLPKSVKTVFAVTLSVIFFPSNLRDGYLGLHFYFTNLCSYFIIYIVFVFFLSQIV